MVRTSRWGCLMYFLYVLLRRSPSQMRFAQILRQTYVEMWTGKQHQKRDHRGKDQPALDAAALRFGDVAALPSTYNLKPNHCSSHGHLARGAVRNAASDTFASRRWRTSCSLPHRHAIAATSHSAGRFARRGQRRRLGWPAGGRAAVGVEEAYEKQRHPE